MGQKIIFYFFLAMTTCAFPVGLAQVPIDPLADPKVLEAWTKLTAAGQQLKGAKQQMEKLRDDVSPEFESRREWKASKLAMDQAVLELERKKLQAMKRDARYVPAITELDDARQFLLSAAKPSSQIPSHEITKASRRKLDAEIILRMIERAVEAEDPDVVGAKKQFDDAKRVWSDLQAQLDEAVKRRPEYDAVRQRLDIAERHFRDAKAELDAALKAAKPIEISHENR